MNCPRRFRKRLNITLSPNIYQYLKRNRKNASSYVEKLIVANISNKHEGVIDQKYSGAQIGSHGPF